MAKRVTSTHCAESEDVNWLKEENSRLTKRLEDTLEIQSFLIESVVKKAAMTVLGLSFGSPTSWKGKNPTGWWLAERCTPENAAMHDSAINRAFSAISELQPRHSMIGLPLSPFDTGDVGASLQPVQFAVLMERELKSNATNKGDWGSWKPEPLRAAAELSHHVAKLLAAIDDGNRPEAVTEHAADTANICMKIAECYGIFS